MARQVKPTPTYNHVSEEYTHFFTLCIVASRGLGPIRLSLLILLALPPGNFFFSLFFALKFFLKLLKGMLVALRHDFLFSDLYARHGLSTILLRQYDAP